MNTYTNNNFRGKMNGKSIVDLQNEAKMLSPECFTVEEYIERLNSDIFKTEVLDGVELFNQELLVDVFIQDEEDGDKRGKGKIKLILNKTDSLYSESNVCKFLECLGSEILKKDKSVEKQDRIKVYHSKSLFDKAMDEQSELRRISERSADARYGVENGMDDGFVLQNQEKYIINNKRDVKSDDMLVLANQINYKLEKRIDKLKDSELDDLNNLYKDNNPIAHTYYLTYKYYKAMYEAFTKYPKSEWDTHKFRKIVGHANKVKKKRLIKNIYSLREDFIDSINAKTRFILFKVPLPDQGYPSWDEYDEMNENHIRYALPLSQRNDLQDDVACIVYDLNNTISKCEFTDMQQKVLELYRKDKTQEDIGKILNISQQMVNTHISSISKKIANKNLEIYTDWYYLNVCRGEYKYCKECEEVQLIHCFNINKRLKDGHETICKKCYNSKQKR